MDNIQILAVIIGVFGVVVLAGSLWSRRQRHAPSELPDTMNVGITSATLMFVDGETAKLTLPGFIIRVGNVVTVTPSSIRFANEIRQEWVTVDDGRIMNRDHIAWITDRKWKDFEVDVPKV